MGKIHRALLFLNVTRPIRFFGVLHHFLRLQSDNKILNACKLLLHNRPKICILHIRNGQFGKPKTQKIGFR